MINFTFPTSELSVIRDKNALKNVIETEKLREGVHIRYKYFVIKKYLYAKCKYRGCKAELRYKRLDPDGNYQLFLSRTMHEHFTSTESQNEIEAFIK